MAKKYMEPMENFEFINGPLTLDGVLWKGTSACLFDEDTGFLVVITSPDVEQLEHFWKKLAKKDKLEVSRTKTTVGNYDFRVEEEKTELVWVYDRNIDVCFIHKKQKKYSKNVEELGEAVRNTVNECKRILLKKGWERSDVDEVTINTDDVPF